VLSELCLNSKLNFELDLKGFEKFSFQKNKQGKMNVDFSVPWLDGLLPAPAFFFFCAVARAAQQPNSKPSRGYIPILSWMDSTSQPSSLSYSLRWKEQLPPSFFLQAVSERGSSLSFLEAPLRYIPEPSVRRPLSSRKSSRKP
jgi:hypothetical protein